MCCEASHEELRDLAGNAFCAFTLAPVLIGLLSVLDWTQLSSEVMDKKGQDDEGGEVEEEREEEQPEDRYLLSGGMSYTS